GSVGIGFAIPAELAEQITDQIVENGRVVRGWLGVSIQNFSEDMASALGFEGETGALVAEVVTNSPASRAGFRRNDVILEIDGVDMDNSTQVTRTVGGLIAGSSHEFTILRNGEIMTLDVTVDELPDNVAELPTSSGDSA
ncbi:MAG TPA: Do family protease, partial [Hyphomonadaceae bacterium]|nr:Do family protease [Hyphomonadaceae bacterium]